ncbi:hypothetical protein U1Q18_014840 [Sarracenia purpurea var. burkii]
MRNPHAVAVSNGGHQLLKDRSGLGFGERSGGFGEAVVKIGGVAEICNHVEEVFVFENSIDLEDIRMAVQELKDFGFLVEALAISGVGEESFVDGLASKGVVGDGGEAAVDDAESPPSDLFAQSVLAVQSFTHSSIDFSVGFRDFVRLSRLNQSQKKAGICVVIEEEGRRLGIIYKRRGRWSLGWSILSEYSGTAWRERVEVGFGV